MKKLANLMFLKIQSVNIAIIKLLEKRHCIKKITKGKPHCKLSPLQSCKSVGLKIKKVKSLVRDKANFLNFTKDWLLRDTYS